MLADFIEAKRDEILRTVVTELRTRYPDQPDDRLLDNIPDFVGEVVAALRADAGEHVEGARPGTLGDSSAERHGARRRHQGFNFDRVVHDYGVVCDAIHALAIEHGVEATMRELQMLNRCIDEATALACEGFLREGPTGSIAATAQEIQGALASASLAFALIRKGRVAIDGVTANIVERNLARVADRVTRMIEDAGTGTLVARRDRIRLQELLATVRSEVPAEATVDFVGALDLDLEGDAFLLALALGHLLRAAVACTPRGRTVTLRVRPVAAAITFEVEDRCATPPDRESELAIATRVAAAHGGKVRVEAGEAGSIVAFEMPRSTRIVDEPPTGTGPTV